jgi:hypothetical protein
MEFTLLELNELIYCVGTATKTGTMVNKKVANKLWARLSDELERRCNLLDMAENGPNCEYSGLPSTESYIKDPIGGGDASVAGGWVNKWPTMPTGH